MEMKMKRLRTVSMILGLFFGHVVGCSSNNNPTTKAPDAGNSLGGADGSAQVEVPNIQGAYTDNYGQDVQITASTWLAGTYLFHLELVDNAGKYAIALNDTNNAYYQGLWSRFDWNIDSNNVLRYCQTAYDASTEQQALDTAPANAQDFNGGCAGFAWSILTPVQSADAGTDAAP